MTRPSETISAVVGSIVGALLIIAGVFTDTSKITVEVAGAITLLVSWIATAVTYVVVKRQRAGKLASAADGAVAKP